MAGTRWVKVDTSYFRNPKITVLTPTARLLHLASIMYAADQLTDGAITPRALDGLAADACIPKRSVPARVAELEEAGLWERNGKGWWLHDFAQMNAQATRTAVQKQRARWASRQAQHRHGVTP